MAGDVSRLAQAADHARNRGARGECLVAAIRAGPIQRAHLDLRAVPCRDGSVRRSVDEDGPSRMLAECRRVTRSEGLAVLMVGPVYAGPPISIGTIHRVTSLEEFDEHASSRGWAIEELAVWNPNTQAMLGPSEQISQTRDAPDYLCG